ncbi:hypothetical protein CDD80_2138 [Ophiocordyceps camponoti-rufipedis]|uniref:Peptidase S8/S53 domain-containing protein n=1 Tax=Ophiocordyceps camponoti-rufipedis TaxID=2004952 RepID=A0A2C5ZGZ8_9HYPO|nr:hypothetical protein CDD80_2138 [Ophiocordyceps camponoti-rufipedis]
MQIERLHQKGITGKGSKIAIIGMGVDYENPALGGCFGPGCVISFGADLVRNEPTPKDCTPGTGHGTSVAGIIAARANQLGILGAAPGAEVGMYRISCESNFTSDVFIDALYRAQRDGATIVSSSVALPGTGVGNPLTQAAERLVASGVVFVQGASSLDMNGPFAIEEPGSGPGVITVGAVENAVIPELLPLATVNMNDGNMSFPFWPSNDLAEFTGKPMEVYALGSFDSDHLSDRSCVGVPESVPDLSDKLILLPDCPRIELVLEELSANGANFVLAYEKSDEKKPQRICWGEQPGNITAWGMIETHTAQSILDTISKGVKPLVTVPPNNMAQCEHRETLNKASGSVAWYSSWGPSWGLGLKPSLTAVGGDVVSSVRTDYRPSCPFEVLRGSLSTPLVASIVALVAEAHGSLSPATMQNLLVSYSSPQLYYEDGFFTELAPVASQGGGLVRAYDAAFATTIPEFDSSGLNFNDTEHSVASRKFSLRNLGDKKVTYNLSHVPAATFFAFTFSDSRPSFPDDLELHKAPASLEFSQNSIAIASKQSATIRVTATAPRNVNSRRLGLWSGWIAVNGTDGSSLSIPYQGISGSIREHQVLKPGGVSLLYGDDILQDNAKDHKPTAVKLPSQGSKTKSQLILCILPVLASPLVRAHVVPIGSDDIKNSIGQLHGFPVPSFPSAVGNELDLYPKTHFTWNGLLDNGGYAPEGDYAIVVRALRIFGDAAREEDWDESRSPSFTISYPA